MRKFFSIFSLLLLTSCVPGLAKGQSTADTSLQGLPAIRVDVTKLTDELGDDGVTQSEVRADVIANLTAAHIPLGKSDYPFLNVEVSAIKSSIGLYSYTVDVNLYDLVRRTEPPNTLIAASVWYSGTISTTDADEVAERLKGSLDGILSKFIEDYYAQNMANLPAPAAPAPPAPVAPGATTPVAPAPPTP